MRDIKLFRLFKLFILRHKTLCKEYKGGGIKNVDILKKIKSVQFSWVGRCMKILFMNGK